MLVSINRNSKLVKSGVFHTSQDELSNEKMAVPLVGGCLGYMSGMKFTTQLCGDCFINHEIRIPSKQPV